MDSDQILQHKEIRADFSLGSNMNRILIPFNCLYDIDFGLIRLIEEDYRSPDVFNLDFYNNYQNKDKKLILDLYKRKVQNPLLLIMKDSNDIKTADSYYQQFLSREDTYAKIIDICVYTGIYRLILNNEKIGLNELSFSILYGNDVEYKELSNNPLFKKYDLYSENELLKLNKISFSSMFFKSPNDIYLEKIKDKINNVTLYFLDFEYNFDQEDQLINKDLLNYFSINRDCEISTISVYDIRLLKEK